MSEATREADEFLSAHPEIRAVDLLIPDINGILRGKRIDRDMLPKVFREGVNLPGSIFAADITGDTVEETGLGFSIGDSDQVCFPVPGTLKPTPWHSRPMGQLMLTMHELGGEPYFADPRSVLARVLRRFEAMRLTPVVAVEMEFYVIDRERGPGGAPQPPISPVTGKRESKTQVYGISELDDYSDLLDDIAAACEIQGIPADTAVAEYAPGQYEINLTHEPDPLSACANAILLKRVIKNVALRHGMEATFMARPYDEMAGSGTHIHVSLIDDDGRNVFANGEALGGPLLHHAVGGLLETMVEAMALFAPNANSYRRFRVDSFVPLHPTWGLNNRTTALRIPAGPDHARRVEHRVAGADCNPYLLMAAVLSGIHRGITHKLQPTPPTEGNACEQYEATLPTTWVHALEALAEAELLPEYLGEDFLRVYLANKGVERDKFNYHVSPLEHEWYLLTV